MAPGGLDLTATYTAEGSFLISIVSFFVSNIVFYFFNGFHVVAGAGVVLKCAINTTALQYSFLGGEGGQGSWSPPSSRA